MWHPGFPHVEVRVGRLHGYHRRFCIYSWRYRGTPERPGRVLAGGGAAYWRRSKRPGGWPTTPHT